MNARKKDWKALFNPFNYIAGYKALAAGLFLMALSALLGKLAGYWQDGIIDLHYGPQGSLLAHFSLVLTNWLSLLLVLTPFAYGLSKSSIRFIDLAGTLALARFPVAIAVLAGFSRAPERVAEYMMYIFLNIGEPVELFPSDIMVSIVIGIFTLLMIIWMVALSFNAYKVSANLKGSRAGISFTAGILIAYVISKFATSYLLGLLT